MLNCLPRIYFQRQQRDQGLPPTLRINDAVVTPESLVSILNLITNPDPRRWYNFVRIDDQVIVHVRTEEPNADTSV